MHGRSGARVQRRAFKGLLRIRLSTAQVIRALSQRRTRGDGRRKVETMMPRNAARDAPGSATEPRARPRVPRAGHSNWVWQGSSPAPVRSVWRSGLQTRRLSGKREHTTAENRTPERRRSERSDVACSRSVAPGRPRSAPRATNPLRSKELVPSTRRRPRPRPGVRALRKHYWLRLRPTAPHARAMPMRYGLTARHRTS